MKVGVCANPYKKIFENFRLVEVQKTFYEVVKEDTLKRWKERAPEDFEFTIKAFQGITHNYKSPTWRRSNIDISKVKEKVGELKLNDVTREFWEKSLEEAKMLGAKFIIVQLPRSFKETEENIKRIYKFFGNVDRNKTKIGIELRGWSKENIRRICEDLDLVDVFDPLLRESQTPEFLYIRLHGKYEGDRIDYKHKYTDEELRKILEYIEGVKPKISYVLFNNVYMFQDAKRFLEMIK